MAEENSIHEHEVDVMTEELLIERYGKPSEERTVRERIKREVTSSFECSGDKAKNAVQSVLPVTRWIPKYKIKNQLLGDIAGGITVGIVHLPQGMAYAILASLPAVTGLYVSFFPVLIYAIFGTSRHISIGTFAVISLMVGAVIDKKVPQPICSNVIDTVTSSPTTVSFPTTYSDVMTVDVTGTTGFVTNPSTFSDVTSSDITTKPNVVVPSSCQADYDRRKIEVAVALSLAVGLIHVGMYIFRLGIITLYLSSHLVSGFTCGAAFHVMTSQIPKLFGLNIPRNSGILAIIYTYIDVFKNIASTNVATLILSAICIIFLVIGKEINQRFKKRLPFPFPWEILVVIFSTIASYFGFLNLNYGVTVVGNIPRGIQMTVPQGSDLASVIGDAIPIAVVIFAIAVSLAQMFAVKHVYETDSNQELLAYGLANIFGSFFSCFPAATSLSRSSIWEETGGSSQVTGLISSVVVLIIMLWIGPLFESLPEAALAAIIIVNLKKMLLQFEQLPSLWRVSKLDATVWSVTWLAVVLLGVDLGLAVGVGYSLLTVIFRTQIANGGVVVPVGETGVYRNTKRFNGNEVDSSTLLFRFPSPIYYANHQRFKSQLSAALGFEPALEVHRQKKLKLKQDKLKLLVHVNTAYSEEPPVTNAETVTAENEAKLATSSDTTSSATSDQHVKQNGHSSRFNTGTGEVTIEGLDGRAPIKHVIIDMSACSFIDNDAVKTFSSIHDDLSKLGIKLLLADCRNYVRKCFQAGNFGLSEKEDSPEGATPTPVFFISVTAALTYARTDDVTSDDPITANDVDDAETTQM
uniref:Sulfate transporter Ci-Slc26a alpha n=1 Tax=Ciona intestinalis TaxID=7719 RepID=T2DR23_CIOIN|nr:sulfate transporter Ci-Slc26a alpha [Ciona intestinalis]